MARARDSYTPSPNVPPRVPEIGQRRLCAQLQALGGKPLTLRARRAPTAVGQRPRAGGGIGNVFRWTSQPLSDRVARAQTDSLTLLGALEDARDALIDSGHLAVVVAIEAEIRTLSVSSGFDDPAGGTDGR